MTGDTSESFEIIRVYDPSITNDGSEIAEYATNRDTSVLKFSDEKKPLVFVCRPLTRSQRRRVREIENQFLAFEMAFRFALVSIRNHPSGDKYPRAREENSSAPLTDRDLDALGIGDTDIEEVGSVVFAKSFLAQGLELRCQLPDSSQAAVLTMLVQRAAEQNQD